MIEKRLSEKLNLTQEQINKIVLEWYLNDIPDLFQNEDGLDLEEVVELELMLNED